LQAGARAVIGFDFDQGALDLAFDRARSENLAFTPLFLDVTNPAPDRAGDRPNGADCKAEREPTQFSRSP
jgi:ribosomal protein L11 methylase PrmA